MIILEEFDKSTEAVVNPSEKDRIVGLAVEPAVRIGKRRMDES